MIQMLHDKYTYPIEVEQVKDISFNLNELQSVLDTFHKIRYKTVFSLSS